MLTNWVHFHGTHFITTVNVNTPLPGTYNPADPLSGVRPYGSAAGNIFDYEPIGIVNQDQMWVEVNSKPSSKVSITANYQASWSSDDFTQGPVSNPYDIRQDYGRSPWNRRNNFRQRSSARLWSTLCRAGCDVPPVGDDPIVRNGPLGGLKIKLAGANEAVEPPFEPIFVVGVPLAVITLWPKIRYSV